MTEYLSELFQAAKAPVVYWENTPLYGLYEFETVPDELRIKFISAACSPVQGLSLSIEEGALVVNEIEAKDMVFWRDTAPDEIVVQIFAKPERKSGLKLWNVWRVGADVTQAWIGNAGMRVEHDVNKMLFRCSDGEGPIDFNNLIAEVVF
jgi:hypothetical protein